MLINDHKDLLTKILICLPAKSLIRFKLVCKHWLSVISSHYFCRQHTLHQQNHTLHSRQQPSLLLCGLAETLGHFYLQWFPNGEKWASFDFPPTPAIWNFSNGLFLLNCCFVEDISKYCYVYNPTSKECRKILLNKNDNFSCILGVNIAFDPLQSPYYKIVCVKSSARRSSLFWRSFCRRCQIEVYDNENENDTWKLCGEQFSAPSDMKFDQGVYSNGSIHWHGMFFDLHNNAVGNHPEIVFPEDVRNEIRHDHYVASGGYMHCVGYFPGKKLLMVFELQCDYSEWLLKYHISLDKYEEPLSVLSIYRGVSDEEDDESAIVLHQPGKVVAHNFRDNCFKELVDFRNEPFYRDNRFQFSSHCTFQFIESLAPV